MVTALDPKTALVVIDLQKGITSYPTAHPMESILEQSAKLVNAFRKAGKPVVQVNVNPSKAIKVSSRKDEGLRGGGEIPAAWLEIVPEMGDLSNDILITKHTWGAFFETKLHEVLQEKGITGIVLIGVATSIGVEGTARQASELGYNITFATDAMTDMSGDGHKGSVDRIFPKLGEVGSVDDVIAKLS